MGACCAKRDPKVAPKCLLNTALVLEKKDKNVSKSKPTCLETKKPIAIDPKNKLVFSPYWTCKNKACKQKCVYSEEGYKKLEAKIKPVLPELEKVTTKVAPKPNAGTKPATVAKDAKKPVAETKTQNPTGAVQSASR